MNYKRIREVRLKRGLTLAQVSQWTGYTASYLSQIERGIKEPSLTTLRKLTDCFDVPLITFFMEEESPVLEVPDDTGQRELHVVIRAEERKEIMIPQIFTRCEFITPTEFETKKNKSVIGFVVQLEPDCWISEKQITHPTDESAYVICGKMEAHMGGQVYFLHKGDSIYIEANTLHNWKNCGDEILETIVYMPNVE